VECGNLTAAEQAAFEVAFVPPTHAKPRSGTREIDSRFSGEQVGR
jgi:hypothetical protein